MTDLDDQHQDIRSGRGRKSGGPYMAGDSHNHDPRVSTGIRTFLGVFSTIAVLFGGWIISTLLEIKDSVTAMKSSYPVLLQQLSTQQNRNEVRDDQQEAHINSIDNRVSTLEGRTFRGVPGYQEPKRGN